MVNLELKMPPALLLVFFLGVAWAMTLINTPLLLPYSVQVSSVFLGIGIIVIVAGIIEFRRHKTTVNPMSPEDASNIVSSGIFRYTRNPMYLGMLLILIAGVLQTLTLLSLLLLPAFVWYLTQYQIKPEERILTTQFGESYCRYLKTTRRWL